MQRIIKLCFIRGALGDGTLPCNLSILLFIDTTPQFDNMLPLRSFADFTAACTKSQVCSSLNSDRHHLLRRIFFHSPLRLQDLTVRDLFGKQLMQFRQLTAEKALAIIDRYPTPTHFMQALQRCMYLFVVFHSIDHFVHSS